MKCKLKLVDITGQVSLVPSKKPHACYIHYSIYNIRHFFIVEMIRGNQIDPPLIPMLQVHSH